jgi:glycosyltransferase involved in cell wall biosynthesis
MEETSDTATKPYFSIVSPVFGCVDSLPKLCKQLDECLSNITAHYEIILVNDASPDASWQTIQALAKGDPRIKGVDLSRNFGQQAAITAGLSHAAGEWVVVMDCDLQDQPKEIAKLYAKAQEGFDVVYGRRHQRQDTRIKITLSRLYRKLFDYLTDSSSDPAVANFGIYRQTVIEAFLTMRERNRTLQLFIRWLGFRNTSVDIEHASRCSGKSAYSYRKLFQIALSNILSQSNKPLKISIAFGLFMATASLLYALFLVVLHLHTGFSVPGWTSVMVSLYFIGGLIFTNLGMLGLYVGKVFEEAKGRPLYVVRERTWSNQHPSPRTLPILTHD